MRRSLHKRNIARREQNEQQFAHNAWLQREQASIIPNALDELAYYEQLHMDSLLYDVMERGIR